MTGGDFHGVFPYLVSPIDDDGNVNEAALRRLIEDVIVAGVHGLTALGSTGEFAYLSWAPPQRRRVVEATLEAARGRGYPSSRGWPATITAEACRQAREFERIGVDGIVVVLEADFPLSEDGVIAYFTAVTDAVDLPLVIYTNPNF